MDQDNASNLDAEKQYFLGFLNINDHFVISSSLLDMFKSAQ